MKLTEKTTIGKATITLKDRDVLYLIEKLIFDIVMFNALSDINIVKNKSWLVIRRIYSQSNLKRNEVRKIFLNQCKRFRIGNYKQNINLFNTCLPAS